MRAGSAGDCRRALGIKLGGARPTVIATLGDGSYLFNEPTACHFVARAQSLPVLTVIFNNGQWGR